MSMLKLMDNRKNKITMNFEHFYVRNCGGNIAYHIDQQYI